MSTSRKQVAQAYFEGFSNGDHDKILALLTDDVVWDVHGHLHLQGKQAFDTEIENDQFDGSPELAVERFIEEGDSVVVPHQGEVKIRGGGLFRFAAVDILTFDGDLIARVESYVVPIESGDET